MRLLGTLVPPRNACIFLVARCRVWLYVEADGPPSHHGHVHSRTVRMELSNDPSCLLLLFIVYCCQKCRFP